jgi:hypothetical protein
MAVGTIPVMTPTATVVHIEAGAGIIEAVIPAICRPAAVIARRAIIGAVGIGPTIPIAIVAGTAGQRQSAGQSEQRADMPPLPRYPRHPLVSVKLGWTPWRGASTPGLEPALNPAGACRIRKATAWTG